MSSTPHPTRLPSGRTYTSMKMVYTTFSLCNPLLLDTYKNTLDFSIQVFGILDMESYNKYREGVSNDQILPLDIPSSSSGDSEV